MSLGCVHSTKWLTLEKFLRLNLRYHKKEELYRLAAENYLEVNDLEHEIRFDVISIIHNNNKTEIEHFISAF